MDPQLRLMLEVAYEAIVDAGEGTQGRCTLTSAPGQVKSTDPVTQA